MRVFAALLALALAVIVVRPLRADEAMRIPAYGTAIADLFATERAVLRGDFREWHVFWKGSRTRRILLNLSATAAWHESALLLERSDSGFLRNLGWGMKRAWILRCGGVAWNIAISW